MTIFGFAQGVHEGVTVSSFFRDNLLGFGRFYGLLPADVSFTILPPNSGSGFVINAKRKLIGFPTEADPQFLIPSRKMLHIGLSEELVSEIKTSDAATATHLLWHTFVTCLCHWMLEIKRLPNDRLIPPSALYMFSDGQPIFESINKKFIDANWSIDTLRRQYHVTTIAHYVSTLIAESPEGTKRFDEAQIAMIIELAERDTWQKYIEIF
ncbi:MAG TPA: hypothetical protein VL335_00995 [Candidatus Paceibacterota bacterium]|jgi:hypothetical protein|nr:hypothetical protein [Candidatus Paceibacterota bacterium]